MGYGIDDHVGKEIWKDWTWHRKRPDDPHSRQKARKQIRQWKRLHTRAERQRNRIIERESIREALNDL